MTDSPHWAPSADARHILTDFVDQVPGVAHAVVASSDGLVWAASATVADERDDRLAAVAAALTSTASGAAHQFDAGPVQTVFIALRHGHLLLAPLAHGSVILQAHPTSATEELVPQIKVLASRLESLMSDRCEQEGACCG